MDRTRIQDNYEIGTDGDNEAFIKCLKCNYRMFFSSECNCSKEVPRNLRKIRNIHNLLQPRKTWPKERTDIIVADLKRNV